MCSHAALYVIYYGMKKHILKKNETLESLSVMYSLPVCMIARANDGFAGGIIYGMEINIPPADFCEMTAGEYTVGEDEALPDISLKTGTLMREILHLNGISPGDITCGMRLFMPASTRIYTVGCGETIEDIGKKTGISVAEIARMNDIEGGVYRGQQLRLQ